MSMKIAVAQTAPVHGNIDENLRIVSGLVETTDCDLIVLPELAFTGYLFTSREQLATLAQPVKGDLVQQLVELSRQTGKAIVTGFMEADRGRFYNSALVISPIRGLIGVYRKVHLFHFEKLIFDKGDLGFPVFDMEIASGDKVRIGALVCYDWRFPEATRALAIKGAQIVAIPSNIVTTTGMLEAVLRVRAFENKVIVAFADRVGTERGDHENEDVTLTFRGNSVVVNYNGELLASLDRTSEAVAVAAVDPAATVDKSFSKFNDIFGDRQESQYG